MGRPELAGPAHSLSVGVHGQTLPMDPGTPRLMWHLFEPVHGVTYFAEQPRRAATDFGLTGYWAGYVVFRAAPLGGRPS